MSARRPRRTTTASTAATATTTSTSTSTAPVCPVDGLAYGQHEPAAPPTADYVAARGAFHRRAAESMPWPDLPRHHRLAIIRARTEARRAA